MCRVDYWKKKMARRQRRRRDSIDGELNVKSNGQNHVGILQRGMGTHFSVILYIFSA